MCVKTKNGLLTGIFKNTVKFNSKKMTYKGNRLDKG